jgi:pSer/pThr/pTyr-binding forkhead associated (FHA) protein
MEVGSLERRVRAPEERLMDPRTPSEVEATGTLPLSGEGTVSPLTEEEQAAPAAARPEWVEEARSGLTVPGKYLAYEDAGRRVVAPVSREWTRIGRSLSADIRFDDATVSRRHALVVNQADGVRVLDDRSLNGVYVNGERVDWAPLTDGDEIAIGRHTIHYFDTATVGSGQSVPPAAVAE